MLVYQRVTDLELVAEEVTLKNQEDVFLSVLGLAESMICYNISQYTMENNGHTTATEESIGNGWELFFSFSDTYEIPSGFIKCGWGSTLAKKGQLNANLLIWRGCDDSFFPIPTWNIFMRFVTILSHIKKLLQMFTSQ
jgi:hypothetical protein